MTQQVNGLWWRWLVVVSIGVMLFSAGFIVAPGLMDTLFDWMFFSASRSDATFSPEADAYIAFTYGVLGSVLIGWMVLILRVVVGPFRRGERAGWDMIALSMAVWFVVDTGFSLASGFWENAVFNTLFFAAFAIPLAATYRAFHTESRG